MDAATHRILALVSEMNVRFVVPVYQRPYSWGREQCARLLEDVVACGRRRGEPHFTGSIVTMQDGSLTPQGVAPLLLIDGQQRIATITLLLVALARYARRHPSRVRSFSHGEISRGGYLTNQYRHGADHYKLMLSKGDERTLCSLVDNLADGSVAVNETSRRLLDNLAFFEHELERCGGVETVWAGLQRLEVVSIRLAQGQDRPQVIFESMNSTGKDLSSADLIRNFILMSYPMDEQDEVYRVYWAPIERTLGTGAYDGTFDDFVDGYLTVASPLACHATGDTYQAFKRYVVDRGYREGDRMRILVLRLKRFARYYRAVTTAEVDDPELGRALARIVRLGVPQANPLLLSLLDRHERKALSRTQFLSALAHVESYLFRRAVCGCDPNVIPALFSSIIARMDAAEHEGSNVAQTLEVALLNEAGGPGRFPADAELSVALASLVERRRVIEEEAGEDVAAADTDFDILTLARTDERVADVGNLTMAACATWPCPKVPEEVLATYRSASQRQAMASSDELWKENDHA